ncbi:hypothetical protein ACVIHI_008198 [Bradyrhizobium sp. USDA 4524]
MSSLTMRSISNQTVRSTSCKERSCGHTNEARTSRPGSSCPIRIRRAPSYQRGSQQSGTLARTFSDLSCIVSDFDAVRHPSFRSRSLLRAGPLAARELAAYPHSQGSSATHCRQILPAYDCHAAVAGAFPMSGSTISFVELRRVPKGLGSRQVEAISTGADMTRTRECPGAFEAIRQGYPSAHAPRPQSNIDGCQGPLWPVARKSSGFGLGHQQRKQARRQNPHHLQSRATTSCRSRLAEAYPCLAPTSASHCAGLLQSQPPANPAHKSPRQLWGQ